MASEVRVVRGLTRVVPAILVALLVVAGLLPGAAAHAADATPITPGTPFKLALSDQAGQGEAAFSFSGTAGQRVTLRQTGSVAASGVAWTLSNGTGAQQLPAVTVRGWGEPGVLTATGSWTLTARNLAGATEAEVTLGLVSDVNTGATFNASVTRTFAEPGVNHNLSFTIAAPLTLGIRVTSANLKGAEPGVAFSLVRPDGSVVPDIGPAFLSGPGYLVGVLDVPGTWTLRLDPRGDTTGTITYTAARPGQTIVETSTASGVRVNLPTTATRSGCASPVPPGSG